MGHGISITPDKREAGRYKSINKIGCRKYWCVSGNYISLANFNCKKQIITERYNSPIFTFRALELQLE